MTISFWQPAASIVTSAPFRSSTRSSSGIAAISCDPSSTATWPTNRRFSAAQALTRWRHPLNVSAGADRSAFPSIAMARKPAPRHSRAIQEAKQAENWSRSRAAKTRLKVSWLGMP